MQMNPNSPLEKNITFSDKIVLEPIRTHFLSVSRLLVIKPPE